MSEVKQGRSALSGRGIRQGTRRLAWAAGAVALALPVLLAGCGKGHGYDYSLTISGTAAAGGPVTGGSCTGSMGGVVTFKDSSTPSFVQTASTDCNGRFSVNFANGFHPPFIGQLAYTAADGSLVQLGSAGTQADIGTQGQMVANFTPLTDLVVAKAGRQSSALSFAGATWPALMSSTALAAAQSAVLAEIAPQLTLLSLPATPDLLHGAFTADGTGVDGLLDTLDVAVDPFAGAAVITNALNGANLVDSFANGSGGATLSVAGANTVTAANLQAVKQLLRTAATSLASGGSAGLDPTGFLDGGRGPAAFVLAAGAGLPSFAPALLAPSIVAVHVSLATVPAAATGAVPGNALAAYDVHYGAGPQAHDMVAYQSAGGSWLLLGDQRSVQAQVYAVGGSMAPGAAANAGQASCTGLAFLLQDNGGLPAGRTLSYALVSGPGLVAPLLYFRAATGGALQLAQGALSSYLGTATTAFLGNGQGGLCNRSYAWIGDVQAGNVPAGAGYTVNLYDDNGTPAVQADDVLLATFVIPLAFAPPLSANSAGAFASAVSAVPSLAILAVNGGSTVVSWTAPSQAGMQVAEVDLLLPTATGGQVVALTGLSSGTATTVGGTVPATVIPAGDHPGLLAWTVDGLGRLYGAQD